MYSRCLVCKRVRARANGAAKECHAYQCCTARTAVDWCGNPASGGEQSSTLAEDLVAVAVAGRAALSTVDREATTGAAINQAIKAGKAALAAGATEEEAMTAAHEVAGTVLGLSPGRRAQWPHTDVALIVGCWIVGTRTDRFGTEDEKATLAAIRRMNIPRTPHENPQDGEM